MIVFADAGHGVLRIAVRKAHSASGLPAQTLCGTPTRCPQKPGCTINFTPAHVTESISKWMTSCSVQGVGLTFQGALGSEFWRWQSVCQDTQSQNKIFQVSWRTQIPVFLVRKLRSLVTRQISWVSQRICPCGQ